MAEKPVARLQLDTRAHGEYFCQNCESENEDALLMSSGVIVCPACKEPMPEFQQFSDVITSVSPIRSGSGKKGSGKIRWAIHWESPDSSQEGTTAYDDMQEALSAAASWIKYQADEELENYRLRKQADHEDDPWETEDQERMDLLTKIVKAIEEGRLTEAVEDWLDYQSDTDPQDRIEIGPSGDVTDSSSDFRRSVDAEGA